MVRGWFYDRKVIIAQKTTQYNQNMWNTITGCKPRWTFKEMDYSSRQPSWILQFPQALKKRDNN